MSYRKLDMMEAEDWRRFMVATLLGMSTGGYKNDTCAQIANKAALIADAALEELKKREAK